MKKASSFSILVFLAIACVAGALGFFLAGQPFRGGLFAALAVLLAIKAVLTWRRQRAVEGGTESNG